MELSHDNKFTDEEYEEIAIQAIKHYLNKELTNDYIKTNYKLAIKRMIYKARNTEECRPTGIKSINTGDTATTFDNVIDVLVVDNEIKALLPPPYVKMY